jgi:hypothetical protein
MNSLNQEIKNSRNLYIKRYLVKSRGTGKDLQCDLAAGFCQMRYTSSNAKKFAVGDYSK